jgi:hypothetical protein
LPTSEFVVERIEHGETLWPARHAYIPLEVIEVIVLPVRGILLLATQPGSRTVGSRFGVGGTEQSRS